jgi:hypothetical protein
MLGLWVDVVWHREDKPFVASFPKGNETYKGKAEANNQIDFIVVNAEKSFENVRLRE